MTSCGSALTIGVFRLLPHNTWAFRDLYRRFSSSSSSPEKNSWLSPLSVVLQLPLRPQISQASHVYTHRSINQAGCTTYGPLRVPCGSVDANRQQLLLPEQEIKELEIALPLLRSTSFRASLRGSDPGVRKFHHSDLRPYYYTLAFKETGQGTSPWYSPSR